jgi:hypothetical protein
MTMEFSRFRDFAVRLLGLSTCHPSIHEMRATQLVDSSFRAPHPPDAAGTRLCLGQMILRSIRNVIETKMPSIKMVVIGGFQHSAMWGFVQMKQKTAFSSKIKLLIEVQERSSICYPLAQ